MKNNKRIVINHGMLVDTVDMKATIEAQAGVVTGKIGAKALEKHNGAKVKKKGYMRINQPDKTK